MLRFTRTDWRILATVAIVASLLIIGCTLALGAQLARADVHASTPSAPAHAIPACGAEDDPSWVWFRCGNRMRGVVTMWGTPAVVTCGTFRYLVRIGDIDTRSTPKLRGDAWCLRGVHAPAQWAA